MKGIFGLVGLLVALAVVGVLVKKQLGATSQIVPALQAPSPNNPDGSASATDGTFKAQSQQIQQQYKQAVDATLQAPRPMPDDK